MSRRVLSPLRLAGGYLDSIGAQRAPGRYVRPLQPQNITWQMDEARVFLMPIALRACTVDRLAFRVATASTGAGPGALRMGLYASDDNGQPWGTGALLGDAGTVSTNTVGSKEMACSIPVSGGIYWIAMCQQGAPATRAFLTAGNSFSHGHGLSARDLASAFTDPIAGMRHETVATSGALPATLTAADFIATSLSAACGLRTT